MIECSFCAEARVGNVPRNVELVEHLRARPECRENFTYLVENIRSSWTLSMSGG